MPRHLAIGDIHGCFTALTELAEFVRFRDDDVIITLGDHVDRGANSCAVIDWLLQLDRDHTLIPLKGNHEVMMLQARDDGNDYFSTWMGRGGEETLRSYSPFEGDGSMADVPDHHWDFIETLRSYYECDTHFFVHANANPKISLEDQSDLMLYWEKFCHQSRHMSGKIMVCGHSSQRSGLPLMNENAICIDTRCCRGGWLSCLCVEDGTIWQANQDGDTRQFHIDEIEAMRDQL